MSPKIASPTPRRYSNRTFTFITKSPPTSYLIRKQLGLAKGSGSPGTVAVGTIRPDQIRDIAKLKVVDPHLAHVPFDSLCKSIAGTAISMGVDVLGDDAPPDDSS